MKQKKSEDFFDVSALIDECFGAKGTKSRMEAEEEAYAFLHQLDRRRCKKES
jgi:hypothetical protein